MLREKLFRWIKNWEGVGAPDQPTIYGITEANYPDYYYRIQTLVETKMPKELINIAIYDAYEHIYKQSNADKIFYPLNWVYFDFYFNAGFNAGKVLQRVLCIDFLYDLKIDGVVGKKTLKVLNELREDRDKQHKLVMLYALERITYYTHLKEYDKGLVNRAVELYKYIVSDLNL